MKEWFRARDNFLGIYPYERNPSLGYLMARLCTHPDAIWLCETLEKYGFPGVSSVTIMGAEKANDNRAMCFYGIIERDEHSLRVAAEKGNPLAMAKYGYMSGNLSYLKKSAELGEPLGLLWYGVVSNDVESLKKSADLGNTYALIKLQVFLSDQVERVKLVERAIIESTGHHLHYLNDIYRINEYMHGCKRTKYEVGRAMMNVEHVHKFELENFCGKEDLYELVRKNRTSAREAVHAWLLIGHSIGFCRDLRKLIGQLIWETRRFIH